MAKPKKADLIQNVKKKPTSSLPALTSGKPAKVIGEYKKAKSGGATKAAAKLVPQKTKETIITSGINMGTRKKIVTDTMKPERKVVESRILSDKAKSANRAMIQANKVLKKKSK